MKAYEEKLTYVILIVGLVAMSAFLGWEIYQNAQAGVEDIEIEDEDNGKVVAAKSGDSVDLDLFESTDLFSPILTAVPTITPVPTVTPAPTQVPFAEGWKVKMVAGPMAIMLDGKNNEAQHTVRLNEIYDEVFKPISPEEYNAGTRGVKIISFDGPNKKALVKNYDGREKEIPPYQVKTPGR